MGSNKRLGYNISNLARAFNEKQGKVALAVGMSPSYMSEIVNGQKTPDRIQLEKIAKYFGMSPEALMNDDFSTMGQVMDLNGIRENTLKMLPLFASSKSLSDPHFAKAYSCQKKLYEAEEQAILLPREEAESLLDAVADNYSEVDEDSIIPEECVANFLSFMFYILIAGRATEIIANYKFKKEEFPVMLEKTLEENPIIKKRIDSIVYGDELTSEEPFQDMIKDLDMDKSLNECFKELKATADKKWSDLVDYYIALQYIFGAVDNVFSLEQNHDFGVDLMLKLTSIGNDYASTYLSSMLIG